MALFSRLSATEALLDLLDREKSAILGGRFDVLERLVAEKERMIRAVVVQGGLAEELAYLRRATLRNHNLLEAMRRGIKAAASRIDRISRGPGTLSTYDAAGRRNMIDAAHHILQRRA